jgi:predicted permease
MWALGLLPVDSLPVPIPISVDLSPDPAVLLFALAITLVTGLIFGLAPAISASRADLVSAMKGDETPARGGSSRLRRIFVAGQIGFSTVLLVAAGLFVRAVQRSTQVDAGFDPDGVYVLSFDLDMEGYDAERGAVFQQAALDRVNGLPGVSEAALAIDLPLDLSAHGTGAYPEGWDGEDDGLGVDFNVVSPGYFRTLAVPLLEGRDFSETDAAGDEPVAIVSRAFADRVWPGESAVGRRFRFGSPDSELRTIVGVVADVKNQFVMDDTGPFVYLPIKQDYRSATSLVVRADGGISSVAPALRRALLDVDGSISMTPVISLARSSQLGVLPQRLAAGIASSLGLLALLLSGLGVYGVVAYTVQRRTREIGIRVALGARRTNVVRLVLRAGLSMTLPGLAVGAVAAVMLGRLLQALLLGLSPTDPVTLTAVLGALIAAIVLACAVPARRALAVVPVDALRSE